MSLPALPRRLVAVIIAVGALCYLPGCALLGIAAVGAATATGAVYVMGDLTAGLSADPDRVAAATEKALARLQLPVVSKQVTALDAQVISRTALDKRIAIKVKKQGDRQSEINIRVGTFGDEQLSRSLLAEIERAL
jgi:hypothetical protein